MTTNENIEYREDVLRELVLYIGAKCWRDEHYGVLKLNKILFFSDFNAYRSRGKPITGAEYRKYPHGPAPAVMGWLKKDMEAQKDAFEYHNPLPVVDANGEQHVEKRLLARRAAKLDDYLTAKEIAIVDSVIEWLRPMTGRSVSEISHLHPGWRFAAMEETIPYFTALLPRRQSELSAADLKWALAVADEYEAGAITA